MGLRSVGSNPTFSNIAYLPYISIVNNLNLILSKKKLKSSVRFSIKNYRLVKTLARVGIIQNYLLIFSKKNNQLLIKFNASFYKNKPFFSSIKLVSTNSKTFFISLVALKKLVSFSSSTIYILNTSRGLISHFEALKYQLGGIIFCIIS